MTRVFDRLIVVSTPENIDSVKFGYYQTAEFN